MFKYIKDILTTITPGQRVIALAFLLLSITVIAVGPKIVGSLTQDTEELQNRVTLQKTEISALTTRVVQLNRQVLTNQQECTNQQVARERELLDFVTLIEREAKSTNGRVISTSTQTLHTSKKYQYNSFDNDTTMPKVSMMVMPEEPEIVKTTTHKVDNSKVLTMVAKLKSDIQKDLNKH